MHYPPAPLLDCSTAFERCLAERPPGLPSIVDLDYSLVAQ